MTGRFVRAFLTVFLAALLLPCSCLAQADNQSWSPLNLLARPASDRFVPNLSESDWQWLRSKQKLVVGVTDPDYPPLDITAGQGSLEGVTADFLGILGSALNLQIEVRRYPDRASAVEALRDGQIDLLSRSTSYEAEFSGIVLSEPYFANQPVVVGPQGSRVSGVEQLSGKRIAIVGDYFSSREVASYYPQSEIVNFNSLRRALEAVSLGQVDFYVGDAFSAQYLISQGYLVDLKMLNFAKFNCVGFSFALSASSENLLPILNKVLDSIPAQARLGIQRRWSSGAPYPILDQELVLTAQEQRWLKRHPRPVLTVDQALAPLTFFDSQQNFHGIVADLLELIWARTGLQFEIQPSASIPEMQQRVQQGQANAIAALTPSPEREELLDFTRPYLSTSFVLVASKANNRIGGLADLKHKQVALPRGSAVASYIKEEFPDVRVVEVENAADAFPLVSEGKVDAAIHLMASANFLISRYYRNLRIVATLDREPGHFSFAVSHADPELLSILNKALLAISPDDMANIVSRWSTSVESSDSVWEGYRTQLYQMLLVGLLVLALVLLWNWRLQLKVRRRNRAEKDLNYRLGFKRALVDGIPHPVVVRDREGRVLTCNRSYLDFTRQTREQVYGSYLADATWMNPQQAEELHREYLRVMDAGRPHAADRVLEMHGQRMEVYHWATPYRSATGAVIGLVCGWIDVTERERLRHQLQIAKDQAEEASRTKSTFLATMSHEIRTPMNAVLGMLELALTSSGCGGCREGQHIEVAYESAKSLLLLIGDILDVAKIESGRLTLMPERAKLRELVESVARVFDGLARQKGLQLRLEMDAVAACDVLIDPLRLKQILSNLVSNAIKFTDTGFVSIRVGADPLVDDRIALDLSVEDSGIGIAEQDQAQMFEPFCQVQQSSRASRGGTGLGLTICRKLAEMMGGTVRLESRPGIGTKVSVRLVLHTLEPLQDEAVAGGVAEHEPQVSLRILAVDDHPANRILLIQQLEYLGHQVVVANDGAMALQVWHPGDFDLIITDCNMPVLSGYGLAAKVREIEREMDVRPCMIFGFTANAQPDEIERCRNAGMDDCLFKPTGLESLRSRLNQVPRIVDSDDLPDAPMPAGDAFDLLLLKEMSGGDSAMVGRLLEELIASNRADSQRLEPLLEEGDLQQLAELAHRIKGAARLVQAESLCSRCVELEDACRDGADESLLRSRVMQLQQALDGLQSQLQAQLGTAQGCSDCASACDENKPCGRPGRPAWI
ncbi:transporter substrate-binding domain-containing protein [Pseudomonas schmalbachii]|uniref:histidine kinase n=1 Tax=Pseudomonas schmalbachii TaxID=2816993 RepID=A0ABS3TSD7_9PSED|nr:transporter substrate-binding domain-containing protein [Pseudomonas schmalbachii]MBO3276580.1 transporter substrate-binding domain-containing protein [Pseudomonas schmalbachii]